MVAGSVLTGSLVSLRPARESDLPTLYEVFADLDTWAARSTRVPQPLTYEAFRDWYVSITADAHVAEFVVESGGEPVGRCALFGEDLVARVGEVGIALLPSARGRGYGTQALSLLVAFAFRARNLQRLHLETLATNAAGLACYGKVGFVTEGLLRRHAYADGAYVDCVVMGLLREEWTG